MNIRHRFLNNLLVKCSSSSRWFESIAFLVISSGGRIPNQFDQIYFYYIIIVGTTLCCKVSNLQVASSFRFTGKTVIILSTQSMIELQWKSHVFTKFWGTLASFITKYSLTFYRLLQSKLLNCRNRAKYYIRVELSDSKSEEMRAIISVFIWFSPRWSFSLHIVRFKIE